jgi:hypothetical protein
MTMLRDKTEQRVSLLALGYGELIAEDQDLGVLGAIGDIRTE